MRFMTAMVATALITVTACTPAGTETTSTTAIAPTSSTTTTEPPLPTGVGVTGGKIHLAAFLPLTGPLAQIGTSMLEGQRSFWRYVNEDLGGVAGTFVVDLEGVDTGYDPDVAVKELADRQASILGVAGALGSPVTEALLAADSTVPIMVGSQAASWAEHENAVFDLAVPTYRDQVSTLWDRAVTATGDEASVGFVGAVGVYGDDCLAGTGSMPQIISRYPAGTTDFEGVITALEGAKALVACVSSADLVRIIATGELLGFNPPIYATAQSFDVGVLDALGATPENLWVGGAPPAVDADTPGMALFRTITSDLDAVDRWTFLGYTQAATFHLLLEQAVVDGAMTRPAVLAARGHIGEVDLGFGWGSARYDGVLPEVPVTLGVPDPDATFALRAFEP